MLSPYQIKFGGVLLLSGIFYIICGILSYIQMSTNLVGSHNWNYQQQLDLFSSARIYKSGAAVVWIFAVPMSFLPFWGGYLFCQPCICSVMPMLVAIAITIVSFQLQLQHIDYVGIHLLGDWIEICDQPRFFKDDWISLIPSTQIPFVAQNPFRTMINQTNLICQDNLPALAETETLIEFRQDFGKFLRAQPYDNRLVAAYGFATGMLSVILIVNTMWAINLCRNVNKTLPVEEH